MKKIGILTQPLHNNYGGLLQAFALQSYLKKTGNEAVTIDFQYGKIPFYTKVRGVISNIYRKFILQENVRYILPPSKKEAKRIAFNTDRFKNENIDVTERLTSIEQFSLLNKYGFDAYIVGSDQVWRPIYSPRISTYFLDFLGEDSQTRRITYAASFGTDNCAEYTEVQLKNFSNLAAKFYAISVREDSAVKLCKEYFGVDAIHVLDPTMLLDRKDYEKLVTKANTPASQGSLMSYVLDKNPQKQKLISRVADELGLEAFTVMPAEDNVYPPVEQWLRGFMDAKYVVTDSFHGVAFSIIFNKPFIAVGNVSRGLARFESLLNMFDLKERLVTGTSDLTRELIMRPINFDKVNKARATQQIIAAKFLNEALNGPA